jgi:hypothetical protein
MKHSVKKLEHKKLMQEYVYTQTDLEYKQALVSDVQQDFFTHVYEQLGEDRDTLQDQTINSLTSKEKFDSSNISSKIKKKSKKLYREITKRSHPDKDIEGFYLKTYHKAVAAYEEFKILDLYECCDELCISYEMDEEDNEVIKFEITETKTKISAIENSFIYMWTIYESPKMKEIIINQFIKATKSKL